MNLFRIFLFYLISLLINIIHCRINAFNRDDISPDKVAPKIYQLINENYLGLNGENNLYTKNLSDYSLELKFLYLNFMSDEVDKSSYPTGIHFFSYINTNIDFIFSLKFTKNKKNEGVEFIYNSNKNSSNLSIQLKKIYANIHLNYIEFINQPNSTYKYTMGNQKEINFDKRNFRYTEKINKILEENEKEIKLFLFESFNSYLNNITSNYPKANEILLYETILSYIQTYKTFPLKSYDTYSNSKIYFKHFKEEKIVFLNNEVIISNINIKFDILYSDYYHKPYDVTIPYIICHDEYFTFKTDNIEVDGVLLSQVLNNVFNSIIKYYIYEYNN